jgi:hypothetical protein
MALGYKLCEAARRGGNGVGPRDADDVEAFAARVFNERGLGCRRI